VTTAADPAETEMDVVILSWERAPATAAAVASVLAQQVVTPRIWIIDQGSGRATLDRLNGLVRDHPEVVLLPLGRNVGVPAGRNLGARAGRASVIVCLDNDAEFRDPLTLARVADRFACSPCLGALAFRIRDARTSADDPLSWVHPRSCSPDERFLATRYCGAGHALRRVAFDRCGGYDDALFFYWEELDLSYRLLEHGWTIEYDPAMEVWHRIAPELRLDWRSGRYFYLVRNRLYLEYQYHGSAARLLAMALGYAIKGVRNGVSLEGARGIAGAVGLARRQHHRRARAALSPRTRAYLWEHHGRHRGPLRRRLRQEVLGRLPHQEPR
jgi:GT2 family glycosyltransferase